MRYKVYLQYVESVDHTHRYTTNSNKLIEFIKNGIYMIENGTAGDGSPGGFADHKVNILANVMAVLTSFATTVPPTTFLSDHFTASVIQINTFPDTLTNRTILVKEYDPGELVEVYSGALASLAS